jgi:hypothetical protein
LAASIMKSPTETATAGADNPRVSQFDSVATDPLYCLATLSFVECCRWRVMMLKRWRKVCRPHNLRPDADLGRRLPRAEMREWRLSRNKIWRDVNGWLQAIGPNRQRGGIRSENRRPIHRLKTSTWERRPKPPPVLSGGRQPGCKRYDRLCQLFPQYQSGVDRD